MIQSIFIVTRDSAMDVSAAGHDHISHCLQLSPVAPEELAAGYQHLSTSFLPFSLCIDLGSEKEMPDTSSMIPFFFLPGYIREGGVSPLAIIGGDADIVDAIANQMENALQKQDIKVNVRRIIRNGQQCSPVHESICTLADLESDYNFLLRDDAFYDRRLFIAVRDQHELNDAIKILERADAAFRGQYPRLHSLSKSRRELAGEVKRLSQRQTALEAELRYQHEHNQVLRASHPAKQLQDYYDAQYEVLPTWYKRFGHLLKWITGKRTFKSFTTKEKK